MSSIIVSGFVLILFLSITETLFDELIICRKILEKTANYRQEELIPEIESDITIMIT